MQAYATELVSIITTALSTFLGGLGTPVVHLFYDLFVVHTAGVDTVLYTADDVITGPTVLAYVSLTFVGIRIAYKFIPMVLKLLKVRR